MAKITHKTKCAIEMHVLSAFPSKINEFLFAHLTSLFVSIIRTLNFTQHYVILSTLLKAVS